MKSGLAALFACLLAASCAGPSTSGSNNGRPDEWGHRPGPQGFDTVIIDAGHGGKDPGAISRTTGQREKDLALDTAQRLKRHLGGRVKVRMMRDDDRFIELDDRASRASGKGNTILLSLHYNSSGAGVRGPETYYWRVDSHGLATRIQRAMASVSPAESGNRGMVRRRLRLTRNPDIPCVLAEIGYLSNPAEARLCADPAYREKMAAALARAILDQQSKGDAGTGALPRPIYAPPSRPTDPAGS
ncbi:N-acetylmuramoyl-L-alanine amidase [Luteolibacter flavescens]|uniref:N-acetylmuramoyl-L-alanine amidase n=1 Tax=Luteolibacter flavescens TaxID=1859460 RepID=A0ABT3FJX4_9BACT|nr:N-acetylmuramoyl-L-alanine amidase [Luteolibacter flavescens]MCW1883871.1 N-acetylmuramoyl-L-alanine amidase [Luteolibacter flavescens]